MSFDTSYYLSQCLKPWEDEKYVILMQDKNLIAASFDTIRLRKNITSLDWGCARIGNAIIRQVMSNVAGYR